MKKSSKTSLQIVLWAGSIVFVIAAGLYYMPREYDHPGFWEALYSTLRLFVFERDLPTFPKSRLLIIAYFLAPLITASALGTAISYMFRFSPTLRLRWLRDHVIICGVGRTGKLLAETMCRNNVPVIGVDRGPAEDFDEWCRANKMPMIFGNFHARAVLEKVGISRARSVIFAAGDDLANLEGALTAYDCLRSDEGSVKLIWAHIANERLAETARMAIRTRGVVGIRFFDTYKIAATRMVQKHFNYDIRKGVNHVTIMGFGKFGRDLFEVMARDLSADEKFDIFIVDKNDRSREVFSLVEELGLYDRVVFKRADISELDLEDSADKAFFLCTDDDLGNLTGALALARKLDATHIYVRMAEWPLSAVAEHLGTDRGVTFVNINDLMVRGIERLPGIFEPAREQDLKRRAINESAGNPSGTVKS